jgi:hypothetical protein
MLLIVMYHYKKSLELWRILRHIHNMVEEENMELQSRLDGVGCEKWLKAG